MKELKESTGLCPRRSLLAGSAVLLTGGLVSGIQSIYAGPSPQNLISVAIGKDFMLRPRLHQERLRRVQVGCAGIPRNSRKRTDRGTLAEGYQGQAFHTFGADRVIGWRVR
jgi:hypothetical protein